MKQIFGPVLLALIFVSQPWSAAAQLAGDDVATFAIHGGAVAPTTTLPDGSSFETGAAVGASGAWWVLRNFGFRGHVTRSYTEGVQPAEFSAAAANAGRVWLYGADVVGRLPLANGRMTPYVSAGAGGKSYRWKYGMYEGGTAFAWSYAGGLDVRPVQSGRFGLILEGRYHRTEYHWHGLSFLGPLPEFKRTSPTVNDYLITAGVSVNF
jgi:hypothetical protein